jgi:putative transposase
MAIGPARRYHGVAMDPGVPHRKRVRHYDLPGHAHELTFSCYRRLPLLVDDSSREELARTIDRAVSRHGWRLTAFVFMPEHVHLVVYPAIPCATAGLPSSALNSGATAGLPGSASPLEVPSDAPRISDLLFAIKRPFSFQMKQRLQAAASPLLDKLTIRQRPGVTTFRFWQEGPGYDRNLTTQAAILAALDYVHRNPVRRSLVERAADYRWSSARWYESEGRDTDEALPRLTPLPAGWIQLGSRGVVK